MGDIHWRVTAKRGRLVTKEYQLERTQEIYVVIDASRLSSQMIDPPGQENGDREPLWNATLLGASLPGRLRAAPGGQVRFNYGR